MQFIDAAKHKAASTHGAIFSQNCMRFVPFDVARAIVCNFSCDFEDLIKFKFSCDIEINSRVFFDNKYQAYKKLIVAKILLLI